EFAETPSGQLTVGEFLNVMLEDACDPPAFKRARMKEANELAQYSHSLGKLDKSEEQSKKPAITEENKLDKELEEEVKQYIAIHEEQKIQTPEEKEVSEDLSILDDDDEFKGIFLDENEVKIKTEFWMDKNADYLDAQEAKLRREKQGLDSGSKKRPRRKNTPKQKVSAGTPAEAAIQLLEQQKLSRKINYDAVRSLFDFDESLG
ncbi:transcription factor TFIIIB subunit brf1, partial [Massospora cicadina]